MTADSSDPGVRDASAVTTLLFTDIEGSTRLWEQDPERMRPALAAHDALARAAVEDHHGTVVKMTGDGMYATFADPVDAIDAAVALQRALADPASTHGLELHVRCGLHAGVVERRDDDFFGAPVNRAARIMGVAHGGQVVLSRAVANLVEGRLPPGIALRDLGLVRLRDLARPEHLRQLLHPELRQDFPALHSLEATPNNLPQQMTSFVGRAQELAEVRALLRRTRLLTLVGVGGLGKTRLSLQVAADVLDAFPDGVWFVELAPLADPERVPQAVASVLNVKEDAGRPVQEALVRFLKDRRTLLVLDNCEHLLQACADIATTVLHAASGVRILASSREPLHVTGEATYPLPVLATPEANRAQPLAAVAQCEAVRLFVDRAAAAKPAFAVTEQNVAAVSEICRRLDGIPLALELAAARVRTLSVEQIAERLGDRFRLLTGGDRTALPRQQTLRACIDWSHDLLTDAERTLLRRLAVFAGGWTIEAAEAVGAGEGLPEADVLDVLARLVDKSLANLDADGGRYELLETVRQYAAERLDASGEGGRVRERHLEFFLAFAEGARVQLAGPQQTSWLARVDLERENLLSAHAFCESAGNRAEAGLRLVHALHNYLINRGLLGLGYELTTTALARIGARTRALPRCLALFDAGWLGCLLGRYADARRHLLESLAIARELGDRARIAATLQPLTVALLGMGDRPSARKHSEEALLLAREHGDRRQVAAALIALAQVHRMNEAADAAVPLYEEALRLGRELADRGTVATSLLNLAMVSTSTGAAARARALLDEALAIVEKIGWKPLAQSMLEVTAGLAASQGNWNAAARLFGAAEAQAELTGYRRDPADAAFLLPLIETARRARPPEAFAKAEAEGRGLSCDDGLALARSVLAEGAGANERGPAT